MKGLYNGTTDARGVIAYIDRTTKNTMMDYLAAWTGWKGQFLWFKEAKHAFTGAMERNRSLDEWPHHKDYNSEVLGSLEGA